MTFEEVIRLLTTSRRYPTLLIPAIFLNVSSEKKKFTLGSVKNNTNSEDSRDGKKQKISAMRDTLIQLYSILLNSCNQSFL